MEMAGKAAVATSAGEEPPRKKKKKRELQHHKPSIVAGSAAVNQPNKESSVEAKEEKTAPVDTTEDVGEAEDKKASSSTNG